MITSDADRRPCPGSALPTVVLAAAVLAALEVSFVLVGTAALWLRGEAVAVGDVDAVIEPGAANVACLQQALLQLAARPRSVPGVRRLTELSVASVDTSYGHVDCMLERGRTDFERLDRDADVIAVTDVGVRVAAAADVWALRRRFRE